MPRRAAGPEKTIGRDAELSALANEFVIVRDALPGADVELIIRECWLITNAYLIVQRPCKGGPAPGRNMTINAADILLSSPAPLTKVGVAMRDFQIVY